MFLRNSYVNQGTDPGDQPGDPPAHLPGHHLAVVVVHLTLSPGSVPTLPGGDRLTGLLLNTSVAPLDLWLWSPVTDQTRLSPEPFDAPPPVQRVSWLPLEYPGRQEGLLQLLLRGASSKRPGRAGEE